MKTGLRAPKARNFFEIECEQGQCIILINYEEKYKYVKKTLTIPKWLDDAAKERDINFSSVLQKALKKTLNLE